MERQEELLTAIEVARRLKCSRAMIYRLKDEGLLPASHKIFHGERGWRWTVAAVEQFIKSTRMTLPQDEDNLRPPFVPVRRSPINQKAQNLRGIQ